MAIQMRTRWVRLLIICLLTLTGCATFNPRPLDEARYRNRAETQTDGLVRVTAAVLSSEETKEVFDLDLYKKGIQPIWLEIENNSPQRVRFAPTGIDKDYFSPLEVSYMHRKGFSKEARKEMDRRFYRSALPRQIPAGETRAGFLGQAPDPPGG